MALHGPFDSEGLGDVLIVDPQEFGRRLMNVQIHETGCNRVVATDTVADALAWLFSAHMDLVIINRRLGISAIACMMRALRRANERKFRDMTVVLSTDRIDRGYVRTVGQLGIDGIVVTPCSAKVLADRINAANAIWSRHLLTARRPRSLFGAVDERGRTDPARLIPLPSR